MATRKFVSILTIIGQKEIDDTEIDCADIATLVEQDPLKWIHENPEALMQCNVIEVI